jgi:tetratricopeptide (TPR) repeat protein
LLTLLRKQPRNLTFILDLAQAEFRSGHMPEAIAYYEQAVQVDPLNVPALNNLAYLLADTGRDPERALMLAQQVKELAPRDVTVDDTIGWAYYKQGLYQTAIEYFRQSKSETPRWKCHLAMAYVRIGDHRHATELLQAALKEDPSVPEAQRVLELLASSRP